MPGVFDHPSAGMPTVFGDVKDPFYSVGAIGKRIRGFRSFAEPTKVATPWQAAGARGLFAKVGAIGSTKIGRAIGEVGKLTKAGLQGIWHPAGWGKAAYGGTGGLLSGLARRAIGPAIILGVFGLLGAARNLIGGGYSMEGPGVAWGHTPGESIPYTNTTMLFSTANRTTQSMGATGSLAFALHNQRKG
jgi:hypothetical protein